MKTKVLFIPGINHKFFYSNIWRDEVEKVGYEFITFKKEYYSYFSIRQINDMVKQGIKLVEENQKAKLIIVCHSFGGILIHCILHKMKKYKIEKIFLMASPLNMKYFGMDIKKEKLDVDPNLVINSKVYSYRGYLDLIVPFIYTKKKGCIKHQNLIAGHMYFLFSRKFIKKVISKF